MSSVDRFAFFVLFVFFFRGEALVGYSRSIGVENELKRGARVDLDETQDGGAGIESPPVDVTTDFHEILGLNQK